MVAATLQKAHLRARIAALTRAVRNGERPAGDPALEECTANWPRCGWPSTSKTPCGTGRG